MGRSRTKNKRPVRRQQEDEAKALEPSLPDVSSIMENVKMLMIQGDFESAKRLTVQVLELAPENNEARENLGVINLELGEIDDAKRMFLSLLPPNPNAQLPTPPSVLLYLAQLSDDDPRQALKYYEVAVGTLMAQLKGKKRTVQTESEDEEETRSNVVRALIGMVELWMDPSYDLCFDPSAESKCEELLTLALKTSPENAEALQAFASVRISQQRPDEAKTLLGKAWSSWKDLDLEDPKVPPIPTRLSLVKMLIESSMFTEALTVVQGIMESDDQDVEAWYLEGWCFYIMSQAAQETDGKLEDLTWEQLATDARDCLETSKHLHENQGHPDGPLLEHVKELIMSLEQLGIKESSVDEEADWEDLEDDEEEEEEDVEMK